MQKDRIYYMWLCYYMWRDCKINYFFCQQGWRPIVKIQLQISMNYSTKHCFIAKIAKSSYWYYKDALHCQRDILTFICLCHCFLTEYVSFEDQRCSASPESHHPKGAASSHPAAQHRQGKAGRKIPPSWATPAVWAETHWLCCPGEPAPMLQCCALSLDKYRTTG